MDFNTWLSRSDTTQNRAWLSEKRLCELMDGGSINNIWRNRNKHARVFSRFQMVIGKTK